MLVPLKFRPGIVRDATRFSNEGGWYDCDKVRFRNRFPETIGGWSKFLNDTFLGTCRSLYTWTLLNGEPILGLGTTWKYYVISGGALYDITPIRQTTAAGDVTFSATDGSTTLTVTDTNHSAYIEDFVTFSGAVGLGGNVTAGVLNAEHQIASIVDGSSYTIELGVTANASDTGNGGASVVGAYQINTGINSNTGGLGWGTDPWGDGGWGEAGTSQIVTPSILRLWSQDNFGEDLVINPAINDIFYWDASAGTGTRAVSLSTLPGASDVPVVAKQVMVSDQDRHVICFGCDPEDDPGTYDPLLVRWSDQENAADWTTTSTNTAGSIRLSSGTEIIRAIQTKREIVIFTDRSMHSMQYLGPPYTFGVQEISQSAEIMARNSVVSVHDALYWMSNGDFMMYDGMVRDIPCDVQSYVFNDINLDERRKITGGHNNKFSEVWWWYPSAASTENDRYVVYNYTDNLWYFGSMARTAWHPSGLNKYPIGAGTDGYLYEHELGLNDGSENPPVAINAYIESSSMDIAEGDRFYFANRIIPDITFHTSEGMPSATMTLKANRFPGSNFHSEEAEAVERTATIPVEQFTNQKHIRLRGRSMALRVESDGLNVRWQLGTPRVDIRTDGKR